MMARTQGILAALLAALIFVVPAKFVTAADASQADIEQLRKEIDSLRRQLQGSSTAAMPKSSVESAMANKYGPGNTVTTRSGKLVIGGLLQVWFQAFQQDNRGLFDDPNGTGVLDTNSASDNSTFRIRRAELTFTMDIHENVTSVVRIDPAREATSFSSTPDNKGNTGTANLFKTANNVSPEVDAQLGGGAGLTGAVSKVQTGAGGVPRLLKDAYINYHGVVPHHDFTIGQFRPQFGEEGPRSSTDLEFCERSMIGQLAEDRDLGIQMHGFWWDDRFQYWLGAFDTAGGYFQTNMNRADTNDQKDVLGAVMVRPLWKNECWGSIEMGYSFMGGKHGKDGHFDPLEDPVNGVNITPTNAMKHAGWMSYKPGGPVRGWWIKGEYQWIRDRALPATVIDIAGGGGTDFVGGGGVGGTAQDGGKPISVQGWYASTGYRMSDCCFCDCSPSWMKAFEVAFRYEELQNVWVVNSFSAENPTRDTWLFKTRVYTAGINYYIKGHNAKIQANYNVVQDPHGSRMEDAFGMRGVKNDNFVINFQVAF
jgi:hypothetical protein